MATTHIIGAGLTGLAAGVTLANAGQSVQLYDATGSAGGRIRLLQDNSSNLSFDGTPAVLFDAYDVLKRFTQQIGSAQSLITQHSGGTSFHSASRTFIKRRAFLLPPQSAFCDYYSWLRLLISPRNQSLDCRIDYYHALRETYLEPISRTLHFLEPHQVSEQEFAKKMRYLLRKGTKGLRLLVPRHSLYHTLIAPAIAQIEQAGGMFYYGHQLTNIDWQNARVSGLNFTKQRKTLGAKDTVILALPYSALQNLMPSLPKATTQTQTILSVHYRLSEWNNAHNNTSLVPMTGGTIDWVKIHAPYVTSISYNPSQLLAFDNETVARKHWMQIAPMLKYSTDTIPGARVVRDRQAVMTTKNRVNICAQNLYFAGQYQAAAHYCPLEAAIESGINTAQHILRQS